MGKNYDDYDVFLRIINKQDGFVKSFNVDFHEYFGLKSDYLRDKIVDYIYQQEKINMTEKEILSVELEKSKKIINFSY